MMLAKRRKAPPLRLPPKQPSWFPAPREAQGWVAERWPLVGAPLPMSGSLVMARGKYAGFRATRTPTGILVEERR